MMKLLSVVIPMYNEVDNIREIHASVLTVAFDKTLLPNQQGDGG